MMTDLEGVYDVNEEIKKLKIERDELTRKSDARGASTDNKLIKRIDKLNERISELMKERNKSLRKTYTRPVIQASTTPNLKQQAKIDNALRPKIARATVGRNETTVKMTPSWFEPDDEQAALKGIVYPPDVIEKRPYNTIARYRMLTGQTNDFNRQALSVDENSTEGLILMLDAFAQQFDGELSFTNEEFPFSESARRTACGVANLGSVHLLASNSVPTAKFAVLLDLDYDKDLVGSEKGIEDFILTFSRDIAELLDCPEDYIRVFSVDKTSGGARINFGITCPTEAETEQLARKLQTLMRKKSNDSEALRHVKAGTHEFELTPVLSYLQLRPSDFAPEFNMDYRRSDLPDTQKRGGYPYNLPIGWYRHALRVEHKYPGDQGWLGSANEEGEWPVAFHGTHASSVGGITEQGLLISSGDADVARGEAIEQMGEAANQPGIYLTTHCGGGAHPTFTKPFTIHLAKGKSRTFRLVFMCRVAPGRFTTHQSPGALGHAWRVVDPDAVRSYGILVKDEDAPKNP